MISLERTFLGLHTHMYLFYRASMGKTLASGSLSNVEGGINITSTILFLVLLNACACCQWLNGDWYDWIVFVSSKQSDTCWFWNIIENNHTARISSIYHASQTLQQLWHFPPSNWLCTATTPWAQQNSKTHSWPDAKTITVCEPSLSSTLKF